MSCMPELSNLVHTDITKCLACGNQLQDPILLPCLHTVCRHCIADTSATQCPKCGTKVEPNGLNEPQDNYFLVSMKWGMLS